MTIRFRVSRILVAFCLCVALVGGSFAVGAVDAHAASKMKVTSSGIKNGQILAKYCYYDANGNVNAKSLPLKITKAPKKAKYYAVYMYDTTVPWVHWLAANYKSKSFGANASKSKAGKMVQGTNDFGTVGYGGPTPPDGTHTYVVKVYALKGKVSLKKGFTYAQFKKAIKGKVLATASVKGKCAPQG